MNTNTRTPATSRTWQTVAFLEDCGTVRDVARHTVTLTMTPAGIVATVDGQAVSEAQAVSILNRADRVTVTAETLAPAPIGKGRACELHKIMARAGVPSGEHYAFAAAALDTPVYSLAALTEPEARAVWRFLTATHSAAA